MANPIDSSLGKFEVSGGLLERRQLDFDVKTASVISQLRGETITPIITKNVDFIKNINTKKVIESVRPTKIVVVDQEPDPDAYIPAGTPVNLVMAFKEDLLVESFNNIEVLVTEKYPLVGSLLEDLGKANDVVAGPAKKVLDEKSEVKYSELQPQDAKAVNDFIKNRFNVNADVAADKEKAASIYENLRFLNSF
jgi:hypothetical protein